MDPLLRFNSALSIAVQSGSLKKAHVAAIAQAIFANPIFKCQTMPMFLKLCEGGLALDSDKQMRFCQNRCQWPWLTDNDSVASWLPCDDVLWHLDRSYHYRSKFELPLRLKGNWTKQQKSALKEIIQSILVVPHEKL
jgi:hypothetical protein